MAMQAVPLPTCQERCEITLRAGLVPLVRGSPGLGKSSMAKNLADKFNLKLVDIRLAQYEPTDLNGFPFPDYDKGRASYMPMDTLPLEGDPIPKGYDGWLILFDEINSADRSVQKASYRVILDKELGPRKIHPNAPMMAAGNKATDNAIVEEMSSALQSRMVHYEVRSDLDSWLAWAARNNIDHTIMAFLRFKPDNLNTFDPDSLTGEEAYACERTWEFASKQLAVMTPDEKENHMVGVLAGTIGSGIAMEYRGYLDVYQNIPEMPDIMADPDSCLVPTTASTLWAVGGMIANNASDKTLPTLIKYIDRMPKENQVIVLRDVIRRDDTMTANPVIAQWVANNNTLLA